MSLSSALEIGKAGLRIYQVASEVTSENIANVNTPGYSRQRVILETAPPSTANGFSLGTGAKISTVERYYDSLLQKQLVNAGTTSGYDATKSQVLQQIEPVFNELAQDGLGAAITKYFNSWQDLSLNPTGQAERQSVISSGQILADQFHYIDRTLSDAITTENDSLVSLSSDVNRIAKEIALLNGQINNTELVYGNANEMRDQRDYLVRQLSENMGIKFTENPDGTTDLYVTRSGNDYYLVDGTQYGTLSLSALPGNYTVTVNAVGGTTAVVDSNMYTAPDGGKLWATLQMRDTVIPNYLTQVNSLASSIVSQVNAVHFSSFTSTGATSINFFNPAGVTAATIALNVSNTTQIAASGSITAPGDNSRAIVMAQLVNTNTMSGGTTTFSNYYNTLVAQVGLDVQTAGSVVKQDEAFMKQLTTLRDSQSGVSLDEELANLIQYQRSFQASSKIITTVGEMMDTLLAMIP